MTAREQAAEAAVQAHVSGLVAALFSDPDGAVVTEAQVEAVSKYAARQHFALLDRLERAEGALRRVEALANAAKRDEATSLSRTFDGGTFGAWVSADQILAALTGADQ